LHAPASSRDLFTLLVSANAARGASGHDAATPATDGSAVTACTIALRVCSFTIWMLVEALRNAS
jgi:hypothetical protein